MLLIRQIQIEDREAPQDVLIKDGKITALAPHLEAPTATKIIDGRQKLMLPPFVDSHVHLDTALTAGEPEFNESGTLFDGIRIWSKRKQTLTKQDVKQRALAALKLQAEHGIQFVRSHVDTTDPQLTALQALLEVRDEVADFMELQLVAFPQEGILSYPNGKALMKTAVELGVDAVGGIPHYEFNQVYGRKSLEFLVDLAEKNNRLVDVHCDEIDDPQSRNLEILATLAYETGLQQRVTASHTVSLAAVNDAYAYKLMRLLRLSRINFVANPLVNMHLGGRFDTYPKRRGLTRVKELLQQQVNVSFGEDDLQDPWYPMGNGNLLDSLYVGVLASGLMGHRQLQQAYRLITSNAAKTLQIEDHYGIEVGKPASFLIFAAPDFYTVLNQRAPLLGSFHNGRQVVQTQPAVTKLNLSTKD
ncbi:dihydroorotase [Fructilactobacillus florum DSM 22689 = JCM 16035]|uniref:Dihydroorotase n=1 Tax=Fructilactobacillus florum DSM 22689 = JCM 16035 TaxID=1423745 RepID=A0A0R2CLL3_9LACO|nr:Cytosine deaminase [Fructilactobacillus florum 2F]KRM92327.1 dihydroorotase [Fructilactobacillus florum DSM 22689 = JCM 16035]